MQERREACQKETEKRGTSGRASTAANYRTLSVHITLRNESRKNKQTRTAEKRTNLYVVSYSVSLPCITVVPLKAEENTQEQPSKHRKLDGHGVPPATE
jgi:hypothetical protein